MNTTGAFDIVSDNSKEGTKSIEVLWRIDLEFFACDIRNDGSLLKTT